MANKFECSNRLEFREYFEKYVTEEEMINIINDSMFI